MPARHYSAYIIGILPSIYDWAVNITGRSPLLAFDGGYNSNYPPGVNGFIGVLAWKRGSLLISMIWTAMVVMVLDRKFYGAAIWGLIGAVFAVFGIIHVPQAGFQDFSNPTWEQCDVLTADGTPSCWDFAEQWMFFLAYVMLSATFCLIQISRRCTSSIPDELDDPTSHAFQDWFKDAAVESHPEFLKMDDTADPTAHTKVTAGGATGDDPEEGVMEEYGIEENDKA
jgi:AGZA family xanthine/uracil permease-like MFS transporter